MAKINKVRTHRKWCYICKIWIEWKDTDENPRDVFKEFGHYDKSRLLEEGKRITHEQAFKRFNFSETDLLDYYTKGVSRDVKRKLQRVNAIPSPHSASHH